MISPTASHDPSQSKEARGFLTAYVPVIKNDLSRLTAFARQAAYHADVLWNDPLFRARTAALQAELDALEHSIARVTQDSDPACDELAMLAGIAGLQMQDEVSELIADAFGPYGLAQSPAEGGGPAAEGSPGQIEAPGADMISAFSARATPGEANGVALRAYVAAIRHRKSGTIADSRPPEADASLRDNINRFAAAEYTMLKRAALLAADRDNWDRFSAMEWLGQGIPKEAGGHGGTLSAMMTVAERLGAGLAIEPYTGGIVYPSQVLQTLLDSPEAAKLLAPAVAGQIRLAMACHEAAARGGLRWTETRATPDNGGFVLNGCKVTVDGGGMATEYLVSARTSGEVYDPAGHSLFLVPRNAPGLIVRSWRMIDGSDMATIELDGVRVSGEALLGKPGGALFALSAGMDAAIVASAFGVLGAMEAAIADTARSLNDDVMAGGTSYADMLAALEQARSAALLGLASLSQPDGRRRAYVTSATKAVVVRASNHVLGRASHLYGETGARDDGRMEQFWNLAAAANSQRGSLDFHLSRMSLLM